ncbi:MAG: zf-HC2 domain-containing protein [Acidobacteria bacterium]|nr:zf-HC2 domain-containing protein [Acidobacteriota bacterium]
MQEYLKAAVQGRTPRAACLNEELVVDFYSGRLSDSEMETIRDHLAECPTCLELAREARQFLRAVSEPIPVDSDSSSSALFAWYHAHRRALFLLAASVLITLSATLLMWRGWRVEAPSEQAKTLTPPVSTTPLPRENPWRDLQIAKAEYATAPPDDLIWRDDGPETPRAPKLSPFAQAMRPYERDDFVEAERQLRQFLAKNPRHAEAHFYRGVSVLMSHTTDAIAPLEAATEYGRGRVVEEAHWYLALAYLKAGEPSKALGHLDSVMETSGKHRPEAIKLRQQVRHLLGQ